MFDLCETLSTSGHGLWIHPPPFPVRDKMLHPHTQKTPLFQTRCWHFPRASNQELKEYLHNYLYHTFYVVKHHRHIHTRGSGIGNTAVSFMRSFALWSEVNNKRGQPAVKVQLLLFHSQTSWMTQGWNHGEKSLQRVWHTCFFFIVTMTIKWVSPALAGKAGRGGQRVSGGLTCGCNITTEFEVKMPRTWLSEQVACDCSCFNNDLHRGIHTAHIVLAFRFRVNPGFLLAESHEKNQVNLKYFQSVRFSLY